MKVALISDFHGKEEYLEKFINAIKSESLDFIIFCGDVVKGFVRGDEWLSARSDGRCPDKNKKEIWDSFSEDKYFYDKFFGELDKLGLQVLVVHGNMDAPVKYFEEAVDKYPNIYNLHCAVYGWKDWVFFGFGGEITESEYEDFFVNVYPRKMIEKAFLKMKDVRLKKIFVTHTPPVSRAGTEPQGYKGCEIINEIILNYKPVFHFCGHAHKARGQDKIGETVVVNPGPLKYGYYAICDVEKKEVKFLTL